MNPGDVFTIVYPFVMDSVWIDPETGAPEDSWRPGTTEQYIDPFGGTDTFAHGEGTCTYTVVSTHKPGTYPLRVFYTREYTDPDGHTFGSGKLQVHSLTHFRRLIKGYRQEYQIGRAAE